MNFVADENLPVRWVDILNAAHPDHVVKRLAILYGKGLADVEWILKLGSLSEKPVIVGFDRNMLKNKAEREALREVNLTYVLFNKTWFVPSEVQNYKLLKIWPEIIQKCGRIREPRILEISIRGPKIMDRGRTADL